MKRKRIHRLLIDELNDILPFCLTTAEELNSHYYPQLPCSMNFGILDVEDREQLINIIYKIERIITPKSIVKIFSHSNGILFENKYVEFRPESINTFPIDLLVIQSKNGRSIEEFANVVAHLRAPEGCPWDREQTHDSLRNHLLEESYEVLDAIDKHDIKGLQEELGDLLLQIVLHAQIAYEKKEFDLGDLIKGIHQKIISRHPHVFSNVIADNSDAVLKNWEKIKIEERKQNQEKGVKGVLDGVPLALPALSRAQEIQERAARVNFDWKDINPVIKKVEEELNEVKYAEKRSERIKELGDLLFAVVNLIRWNKADAESLLRAANQKFVDRFRFIETQAQNQRKLITELSFEEMDELWNQAKKNGI